MHAWNPARHVRESMTPDYTRRPCLIYPRHNIPSIGRQLGTFCRLVETDPTRRHYIGRFFDAVRLEGRRRGWGAFMKAYDRARTAALYEWAVERIRREDSNEAELAKEWGPYRPEKLPPRISL